MQQKDARHSLMACRGRSRFSPKRDRLLEELKDQVVREEEPEQDRRNMGGWAAVAPPFPPTFLQSNENENRELFLFLKKALNQPPTQNFVPPGQT